MGPHDLSENELLALVGLAKLVVRADHELSPEEATRLNALARRVGAGPWGAAVAEAQRRLKTEGQARAVAALVVREEARRWIYAALEELAGADGLVPEERQVLAWLEAQWSLS